MATKKDLLGNELLKEIVRIRIDTLWSMIALKRRGRLPPVDAEKATGDFDDKGALFLPGGMVLRDWEDEPIKKRPYKERTADGFRRAILRAMAHDGASLLYPDGLAARVKLGNTAFAKIASSILENKRDALRRTSALSDRRPRKITSEDITRSYCPNYIPAPYGARTSLSSDVSVCMTEPRMYFRQCVRSFGLRASEADQLWKGIRASRQPVVDPHGAVLAPPLVVTCHSTRHREEIYTGITRLSGFGRFGEFATLTLERATGDLLGEAERPSQLPAEEIVADDAGTPVVLALRVYPRTNPGARLLKGVTTMLVSPERDLGLDLAAISAESRRRYMI